MYKQRFLGAPLLAVAGLVALFIVAPAAHATGTASVPPVFADGNPKCEDYGLTSITKFEGNPVADGSKNGVTIDVHDTYYVKWTSTVAVDWVIVKGGSNSNIYKYATDTYGDDWLSAPMNGDKPYGLSHVEFCTDGKNEPPPSCENTPSLCPPVYDCEGKELPPGTTPPVCPPPVTPPVTPPTTPPTTPPVTPPAVTPPAVAPPVGGVLPETVVSGIARLRGPSGCVKTAFRAKVSGRSIAAVAFYLDGKLVKRFSGPRSVYSIKIKPAGYGFGRHRVVARVTFSAESGTAARRLPLTFRRCAQGAVNPRFTG